LKLRVKHAGEVVGEGELTSLQKDKQVAKEAFEGDTCGMSVATTAPIELGDTIEFYQVETKARTL
jgi:translation initiation factor IF-2